MFSFWVAFYRGDFQLLKSSDKPCKNGWRQEFKVCNHAFYNGVIISKIYFICIFLYYHRYLPVFCSIIWKQWMGCQILEIDWEVFNFVDKLEH